MFCRNKTLKHNYLLCNNLKYKGFNIVVADIRPIDGYVQLKRGNTIGALELLWIPGVQGSTASSPGPGLPDSFPEMGYRIPFLKCMFRSHAWGAPSPNFEMLPYLWPLDDFDEAKLWNAAISLILGRFWWNLARWKGLIEICRLQVSGHANLSSCFKLDCTKTRVHGGLQENKYFEILMLRKCDVLCCRKYTSHLSFWGALEQFRDQKSSTHWINASRKFFCLSSSVISENSI